ncbi:putative ammonium transporter 3 [Dendronephthya gigantea]|uniref:putative ammonium transporter 3 n=1 Tax=Dendronephthya gigantea TaxID=151771 RepID=UPI00106CECA8|nr:putative ammonium transporter 3 [Dendronephthya gigantea]
MAMNTTSNTTTTDDHYGDFQPDDATWILTSAFIIFTMQSGFGLLEAGIVSRKNETNIMVKNAIDVIYGGLAYWIFGFAISFGNDELNNRFMGWGDFFVDSVGEDFGIFAKYFFQLSFATTATTIVSGAMAERVAINAYIAFSFVNTLSYSFPAHWVWDDKGFLKEMGVVDVAGCGPVHLVGGVAAIVAAIMLKPRKNKFDEHGKPREIQMASPTNVLLGTFMLWWGWLGFNCGSTFGISGIKWKLASRSAVVTINGSVGGGVFAMIYSYVYHKKKLLINIFVVGILGGLVSVTAICAVCRPWEALIIGVIGAAVATGGTVMEDRLCIDDPVGAFPTHALASVWGLIATGLFCERTPKFAEHAGLFKGGSWKFLGVQLLASVSISAWAAFTTIIMLYIIDKIFGLRMSEEEEEVGADFFVHNIRGQVTSNQAATQAETLTENENGNTTGRNQATSPAHTNGGNSNSQESYAMECPPFDMQNLQEINSRHSSGQRNMQSLGIGASKNGITFRVAPYLESQASLPKGTSNCGYHSS